MNERRVVNNKFMLVCGITCAICGLIILTIVLIGGKPFSIKSMGLGILSVFNGCVFTGLAFSKDREEKNG